MRRSSETTTPSDGSHDDDGVTTGLEAAAAGAVVKLAIERGAPAGIGVLRSWLRGKTIVVVGQPQAGKSTFIRYVQYGIFEHADEMQRTWDPIESPKFNLRLGPDRSCEVSVKTVLELPGQVAARNLADSAFERRPHALLLLLDLTHPLEGSSEERASATWLRNFCRRFDERWQRVKADRNRLRSVIIVMNKMDIAQSGAAQTNEVAYRKVLSEEWRASRGPHSDDPLYRRCIMVENPDGTKWVDRVLVDMATALIRKS
jgi:signal recognition particle receptor subunit beta